MLNKNTATKLLAGILSLAFLTAPQLSYADWDVGVRGGAGPHVQAPHFWRWHDHPHWGVRIHMLPAGYTTVWVGGARYYYYDGLYYSYAGGEYVIVNPPIGAYVRIIPPDFRTVVVHGRTYYTDNGFYYVLTRHRGYKLVAPPVKAVRLR